MLEANTCLEHSWPSSVLVGAESRFHIVPALRSWLALGDTCTLKPASHMPHPRQGTSRLTYIAPSFA
jgi:hypothetical protein